MKAHDSYILCGEKKKKKANNKNKSKSKLVDKSIIQEDAATCVEQLCAVVLTDQTIFPVDWYKF